MYIYNWLLMTVIFSVINFNLIIAWNEQPLNSTTQADDFMIPFSRESDDTTLQLFSAHWHEFMNKPSDRLTVWLCVNQSSSLGLSRGFSGSHLITGCPRVG